MMWRTHLNIKDRKKVLKMLKRVISIQHSNVEHRANQGAETPLKSDAIQAVKLIGQPKWKINTRVNGLRVETDDSNSVSEQWFLTQIDFFFLIKRTFPCFCFRILDLNLWPHIVRLALRWWSHKARLKTGGESSEQFNKGSDSKH